jgi:hypothetical protein
MRFVFTEPLLSDARWRDDNSQTRAHSIEDEDDDEYEDDRFDFATSSTDSPTRLFGIRRTITKRAPIQQQIGGGKVTAPAAGYQKGMISRLCRWVIQDDPLD